MFRYEYIIIIFLDITAKRLDIILEIFQNCDAQEKNNLKFSSMHKLQFSETLYAHNGEKQNLDVN